MEGLISIIVPIYKVECFLDKCIQSIVSQTWKKLEIILVDDESPDKCPELCERWKAKDDRIKVIHKKNGGLSDARNAGLEVATGSYIAFVDGDDWMDSDFFESLIKKMQETGADIVTGGIKKVWPDKREEIITYTDELQLNNCEAMKAIINESYLKQPVWYKLYRADIAKILFKKGVLHEDNYWSYQVIAKANKIIVMPKPYYYYRQRANSIMSEDYSPKRLAEVDARAERQKFLLKNYPQLADQGYMDLLFSAYYQGTKIIQNMPRTERKKLLEKVSRFVGEYTISEQGYKELKWSHKAWYKMARFNFTVACFLRYILRIG